MRRKRFHLAALAALAGLGAALALTAARPALSAETTEVSAAAAAAPVKIMPLGDSITGSPGCWRATLWSRLQSTGYTNIDFVGTLPAQGCGVDYDGENEGHGGILATNMADQNQLPPWLAATNPDIVLMHLGTNDVWSNRAPDVLLAAFSKLVDQMRANNANVKVLVAQIIPMNPSSCAECAARVVAFNAAIPAWAAGKSTAQSPIVVVDQWTGFNTATDTGDGVHPNAAGAQKMSDRWYPALTAALNGSTPTSNPTVSPTVSPTASPTTSPTTPPTTTSPTASPTASPTTSPTTTSPTASPPTAPAGGCAVTYLAAGQWQGGFQGEVTVRNASTTPSTAWTVTFSFANGQTISQSWGGTVSQSGSQVTIKNAAWNGALASNATATTGFIGTWTGTNSAPTPTCTLS